MNIRWKVTALIATVFALLGVTEILVARNVLMPSFTELEHTQADVAMRRIQFAVGRNFQQIQQAATDWGNWTDTYRFAHDHNRAFVDENVTPVGLRQLNINVLMILDLNGQEIASGTLDLEGGQPLDLDLARRRALTEDFPWRSHLRTGVSAHGFLRTDRGILMIAAAPILDGLGHGPSRGMVLMGRLLNGQEIAAIGSQAQAHLTLQPKSPPGQGQRRVQTDDAIQVYLPVDDIYGNPILTFRVDEPREITHRGHTAVVYATAYLIGAAVLVMILLVVQLNRVILNPLAQMTRHAVAIGQDSDLTGRLDFKRADEIGVLAGAFDRMVARVAESRGQLVDQSFQAGFAELAKGVLHNLGNAMTPIGVRVNTLRGKLRAVPIEDFEMAATELARGNVDPARRADLEEFVRLACGELSSMLKAAQDDVEVMVRQTSIVQSALSEQMRSTRNEHVVETLRLPELLSQSLDVVPDSARQRLLIEVDESLNRIGAVTVPRTVLRLVLQNFMINAADATRDAGKAQGRVRVTADIVREGATEQLCLHCADEGVGIAAENLTRVFEKGFSTKSKETNFGIGLHWCANAVGALGGRVWASSEGPGRGACLHVSVPIGPREDLPVTQAA